MTPRGSYFAAILRHLGEQHDDLDIINFTGGEPTLHPELPELLRMARAAGIRRLTVSTNGLKLLKEEYTRELAEADARIVLSLDTYDAKIDQQPARITTPDLHRLVEEHTGGRITGNDFVPSPLAHPHCYSICYLLMLDDGGYVPYARFMGRARLFELLGDSLYIQPRERVEQVLRDCIDDLWSSPDSLPEADAVLATLNRLIRAMFPPGKPLPLDQRQKIAERATKAIYIHSHMDEESFDVARVMRCSVGVPEIDGSNIPTCSYNVLYRERDPRFADPDMLARMEVARDPAPGRRSLPILQVNR